MVDVDRLSLLTKTSPANLQGASSIGVSDKINFDAYPDNVVSMTPFGLIFKISIDDMSATFQGFPVANMGLKLILFAPRMFRIHQGFCFVYARASIGGQTTYQETSAQTVWNSSGYHLDMSSIQGIALQTYAAYQVGFSNFPATPVLLSSPQGGSSASPFFEGRLSLTINNDGSLVLTKTQRNVTTPSKTAHPCVGISMASFWVPAFFHIAFMDSTVGSFEPLCTAAQDAPSLGNYYKNVYPDSWFV